MSEDVKWGDAIEEPENLEELLIAPDGDLKILLPDECRNVKRVKEYNQLSSRLIQYALDEFRQVGWMDENCIFEEGDETEIKIFNMSIQEAICSHILELLRIFSNEGHSGYSAMYTLSLFNRLVNYKPILALISEDDEWEKVSEDLYQNKRCFSVFKNDTYAYDQDAVILTDVEDSYVQLLIDFPYDPPTQPEKLTINQFKSIYPKSYKNYISRLSKLQE
ncbi:MAG: hypothetical protein LBD57_04375 [Endomicrobium sp.]|jgi:hypothetical protein|uniref:hypothetical protein n=1 Tax=Candidatus Endomicrobiellum cubanum TaxID=3242325 RepID=UPI00282AC37C|nr:hypothetical protein [Endomicrobium sp.]